MPDETPTGSGLELDLPPESPRRAEPRPAGLISQPGRKRPAPDVGSSASASRPGESLRASPGAAGRPGTGRARSVPGLPRSPAASQPILLKPAARPTSAPGGPTAGAPGEARKAARDPHGAPSESSSDSPSESPNRPRPFQGWGTLLGRLMAVQAEFLLKVTRSGLKQARVRGRRALAEFSSRPEHTRWRIAAFSGYGLLVLATLVFQLWSPNALAAYVKLQPVSMPDVTVVFVRNDSQRPWSNLRLTLNGLYVYERNDLPAGGHVLVKIDRFAVYDPSGKTTFAPKDIRPRTLTVECDAGRYEEVFGK